MLTLSIGTDSIRTYVIEDDYTLRQGLQWMLTSSPGFTCVEVFSSCEDAFQFWNEHPPPSSDVVLMDINLPGMSGIEGTEYICNHWSSLRVIMLTIHDDTDTILQTIQAGAVGYLIKTTPPSELLQAIRVVHKGGSSLSGPVAYRVLQSLRRQPSDALLDTTIRLTPREREILQGLADGLTYLQLGQRYGISLDTVRSHIKKVYEKLNVHSRGEAVALALRHNLLSS